MSSFPRVVVYGASGHALACRDMLENGFAPHRVCEVIAYMKDGAEEGASVDGLPLISFEDWQARYAREIPCIVSIAAPTPRKRLVQKVVDAGGFFIPFYDRPEVAFRKVKVGEGSGIALPVFIGQNSRIGAHVLVSPMCSIGHDVTIGDYCSLAPSVTISGNVVVKEGVFLGAGSVVVNGKADKPLIIGEGCNISAGAVVTKSVPDGETMIGNPAITLDEFSRTRRYLRDVVPEEDEE
ncbi:LbetaH domain-containing protein [Kaistia algarum]|uniref:hypothetical protein n=1 Tax=Kaistia algarum TaxID=2083279 RepID=UPI00105732D2|nr:hypothetical protein [Kaistia algarum]MCX5515262.1 hypothetical protein [Kaistia algarum]